MDLDADGRNDLLSGSWPGEIHWFRRKPNGTYAAAETLRTAGGTVNVGRASAAMASDWDGDGDFDLLVGTIEGTVFLVPNTGSTHKPVFGTSTALRTDGKPIKVDSDAGPHVADWDGDGKRDLLVGSGSGGVLWFRNLGTNTQPTLAPAATLLEDASIQTVGTPKRSAGRSKPVAADWNGDGRLDLVVGDFWMNAETGGSATHGSVWVYLRQPAPP